MEFTGTYYQCVSCNHISDCNDSHCSECGSQDETEISPKEIKKVADQLMIKALYYEEMLKQHDDF